MGDIATFDSAIKSITKKLNEKYNSVGKESLEEVYKVLVQFSSELERTAKYTLNGTLPLSCSEELREWNRGNTKKLNDRVDNCEALWGRENAKRGRENANSNVSAMIKASAERA